MRLYIHVDAVETRRGRRCLVVCQYALEHRLGVCSPLGEDIGFGMQIGRPQQRIDVHSLLMRTLDEAAIERGIIGNQIAGFIRVGI